MERFDPGTLDETERAFVESIMGIHCSLETLKIAFPEGRLRSALEAMQRSNLELTAAAIKSGE